MEENRAGETRVLARYAAESRADDIPGEVRAKAKQLLLDQIGCQIAGVQMPWSQKIYDALSPLSSQGSSTVVGHEERLVPDAAGFLNSAFGHSNESDDTHLKSPTHPGAVIVPAAIAVGENVGASGAELLAAIVVGYEVMLHVSQAVSPGLITRGHHPPPAVGPFGAAAAAARLMGLDLDQTLNALAIAGSHSAGLQEYTQTGGSVKRLHCALPVQAGIRSAILARSGVTGPPTVLEGKRGFCEVFAPAWDAAWLTKELGASYLLMETSIKGYSCCHLIHQALDGVKKLRSESPFGAGDVAHVEIFTQNPASIPHVGAIKEPADVLAAQFSISFSVAMLLAGMDCWWWDYQNVDLQDPELLGLSNRVDFALAEQVERVFTVGLRVVIHLRDGRTLETTVEHARGEPENPMTSDEVDRKFRTLATPVIGSQRAEELVTTVQAIEGLPDLAPLSRGLAK